MVYLFLADGFEEIEALCVLDFLRRAGVSVTTVGVSGKIANGSHKIPVTCDILENELDLNSPFDMIILPGGMPGSTNLDNSLVVDKMIKRAVNEDKFS
ncbi:MAG: DJ-1 family protein, partial [Ruminococcaceae bacterium]|nr:DJ-1 family protein [Oscillospiraceae bacterium]